MGTGKRTKKPGMALGSIAAISVAIFCAWLIWSFMSADTDVRKWAGPSEVDQVTRLQPTSPTEFAIGSSSRLAILLTRRDSSWLPLIHGLKASGVPIRVVEEVEEAIRHSAILVYPAITERDLDDVERESLRSYVNAGGLLIANQVWSPDMAELFGFSASDETRSFAEVSFLAQANSFISTEHPFERTVRIGNPEQASTLLATQSFSGATEPWAVYEDGSPAIVSASNPQGGRGLALGVDVGFWASKVYADRDADAQRVEVNGYDPSLDMWMRLIKAVYLDHHEFGVALYPVPGGKELSGVLTVDVPAGRSVEDVRRLSEEIGDAGRAATFFFQTQYTNQNTETGFFDPERLALLRALQEAGMSIASHSVIHPESLASFAGGTGQERYPRYPGSNEAAGATLLGELRVSKHLLQTAIEAEIVAYRPGRMETLNSLPQLAGAVGYMYVSSIAASNVMSYRPFQTTLNGLGFVATDVFQFPIAVTDQSGPLPTSELHAQVDSVARSNGVLTAQLANADIDLSSAFLSELLAAFGDRAWIGGLNEFGAWWQTRDQVGLDVRPVARGFEVSLTTERAISDICVETPEIWVLIDGQGQWRTPNTGLHCTDLQPGRASALFALG